MLSLNNTAFCYFLNGSLSTDEARPFIYTAAETVLITVFLPVVSVIGILLNSAFLFTLYRVEDMRTTTNIYLANLAVADVMLLAIRLANYLGTYLYSNVDYRVTPFTNRFVCGIPLLLLYLFHFACVFFISLVAFERYNAICRPTIHRQTNSRTRAVRLSLMSWAASLVIVACHSWTFRIEEVCVDILLPKAPNVSIRFWTCRYTECAHVSITIIDVCQFLLASVGNCTLYIFIVRRLNQRTGRNTPRERNHVAKMLAINACVFFICLAPLHAFNLVELVVRYAYGFGPIADALRAVAFVTAAINSAVNPLIYNAFNPRYREAFRRAFTRRTKRRQHRTSSENHLGRRGSHTDGEELQQSVYN